MKENVFTKKRHVPLIIIKILKIIAIPLFCLGILWLIQQTYEVIRIGYQEDVYPWLTGERKKCKFYADLPVDSFFYTYTVNAGDSLASIARDQLGDENSRDQIINWNEEKYPILSLYRHNTLIEPGWTFKIPIKEEQDLIGIRYRAYKVVPGNKDDDYLVSVDPFSTSAGLLIFPQKAAITGEDNIKVGACITVLEKIYREPTRATVTINKQ